jgi:hypothetical protein
MYTVYQYPRVCSVALVAHWMVRRYEVRSQRVTTATSTTTLLTLPGPRYRPR